MDPLSLTASILTIVGAAGAVGNGFSKLIGLRHAPGILLALNNEVADLYCVVQAVDHLLREHSETIHTAAITNLCRSLERAQSTLFELEDLIRDGLTIVRNNGGERKLDRVGWLRSASKVRELKNQLRADRIDLSAALSLLASSASLAVDIQLRHLTFSIQTLGNQVDLAGEALISQVQGLVGLHGSYSDFTLGETDAVYDTKKAVAKQSLASTSHPRSLPPSFNSLTTTSPVTDKNTRPRRTLSKAHSYPTSLKVTKNTCALDCGCACHRRNRLKSPNVLNTLLGTLFVGYQASPWFSRGCNEAICQSRSAKITYAFPQWFLRRTISFTMGIGHPGGLEFSARMMRVRPDDSDIFMAVFRGGCNHVKRLLGNGSGSVLDVDTQFNTALHWALRKMHFQTIELLVLEGSDVFCENSSGAFPYFMAWEKILGESEEWGEDELDLLKDLFSDQSHLDSFHFSELHAAYLGISGKLFGDVLGYTKRSTIDEVDVSGRTTLSWAAQRGDCKAAKQLLEHGANVNKPDVADKTPLHWSERANDSECMRLLLLNDADVEAKDSRGRTVLSYVASKKVDPSFLEILVGFKADIESEDDERWRPLHWAAHQNCPVTLSQLLDKGADTNATDNRNRSALHLAILRNCHENIKILIERQACGKPGKSELGYTILHTAARYGDMETLTLLQSAALGHISIDERNKDGFTAMADAQWRRDENKQWADVSLQPRDEDTLKWYTAFETLVESIRKDQQTCFEDDDDDVRGGMCNDDESPEWIEISAEDDHEIWEDALDSADGSFDVDTPDQGRIGVAAPWPTRLLTMPSQRRSSI